MITGPSIAVAVAKAAAVGILSGAAGAPITWAITRDLNNRYTATCSANCKGAH